MLLSDRLMVAVPTLISGVEGTHALGNAGERQHALSDTRVPFLGGQFAQGHGVGIQLARARLAPALPSCERRRDAIVGDNAQP